MATTQTQSPRQRVPAAERRDALIDAAVHEFALRGLYGTPVDKIARRVGVAQPYVFSLFGSKKELFLAAVERGFELTAETFTKAAAEYDPAIALPDAGRHLVEAMPMTQVLLEQRLKIFRVQLPEKGIQSVGQRRSREARGCRSLFESERAKRKGRV